jgi:23S rRNA pseudouridine2605 synthase
MRGQRPHPGSPRHGLVRVLSKMGYCSRSEACVLVAAGRVQVNGTVRLNPEWPVQADRDRVLVDGVPVHAARKVYLMLNKPRGLVTTASDERERETVFACLQPLGLPHLAAVGRLDKASEGLLLFTNDSTWAARITDPGTGLEKIYHVQVNRVADEPLLDQIRAGVEHGGEHLGVGRVAIVRSGGRNSWLEIRLREGRNRHLRRLLETFGLQVLRLVRVAIGPLQLGALPKGQSRLLTAGEVAALGG